MIRACSGSSRRSAASSRSTAFTWRGALPAPCARDAFEVRVDRDFDAVIAGCAEPGRDRDKTWINTRIRRLYGELFDLGHCHTVEVYRDGRLVGGLYGVTPRRRLLRREHVPPRDATPRRWRSRISWRGC